MCMASEALREKLSSADARRAALEAEEEAKVPIMINNQK